MLITLLAGDVWPVPATGMRPSCERRAFTAARIVSAFIARIYPQSVQLTSISSQPFNYVPDNDLPFLPGLVIQELDGSSTSILDNAFPDWCLGHKLPGFQYCTSVNYGEYYSLTQLS